MLSGSYMHDCLFNLEPILLVFSLELNACRFQLSPMHVHYYYYTHHSVVQVKGNNEDIWWTHMEQLWGLWSLDAQAVFPLSTGEG